MSKFRKGRHGRNGNSAAGEANVLMNVMKIGVLLLAVAGVFYFYKLKSADLQVVSKETNCPIKAKALTVLLVDVTDPLTPAQEGDLTNEFKRLVQSNPRKGEIAIFVVDRSDKNLLRPVEARCNPGDPAEVDSTTGNPKIAEMKYEKYYRRPLMDVKDTIVKASGANSSPILESIRSVAVSKLKTPEYDAVPKKLVVVSDMLQKSGGISFYGNLPDASKLVSSAEFNAIRSDLRDIDVELWQLYRPQLKDQQGRTLVELWEKIISKQGGDVVRTYRVSG